MSTLFQVRSRRFASVIIGRVGYEVRVWRPDGTEPLNKFHKKDDTDITYTEISADENAAVVDEFQGEAMALGGRIDEPNVDMALDWNTDAQEGDKLEFINDGREWRVEDLDDVGMYQLAHCTKIQ